MYIVTIPGYIVGPFKNHRSAQKWLDTTPFKGSTASSIRVILEPVEWSIFEDVIPGMAIDRTSTTGYTQSSRTKGSEQK